ncbi:MAG: hypothetical protein WC694_02080 [Candidatus Paceibacterota bacterium]|jgi:CHASE3 domain sensor protein
MNEDLNANGNPEIDKALKEFAVNSAKDMSYKAVKFYNEIEAPKMVKLTMKLANLKEQKQAEYALFGFVILAIGISFYLLFWGGHFNIGGKTMITSEEMNKIMNVSSE